MQPRLFEDIEPETAWRPPESLPELGAFDHLGFDTETTGLDVLRDRPVGIALCCPDGKRHYLPFGHRGGGNLDETSVKRWANQELRNKELRGANLKFDHHMMLNWGVDLEAQGCRLRDVQYQAALLDDHRRTVKLETLAQERLGHGKLQLNTKRVADLPASRIGPYAEEDAYLAAELYEVQQRDIIVQDLARVQDLEDNLTYVTAHMERQGAPLDVPKLRAWRDEVIAEYSRRIILVAQECGVRVNPNSPQSVGRLLECLRIEYDRTATGLPSIAEDFMKTVEHPLVTMINEARSLDSLRSKYLDKYLRAFREGVLYYHLHQLRGDEYGTISGRYSSANVNIQQVFHPEKQVLKFGEILSRWIVRELFVPAAGQRWFSADASQIEFRLAAHYAGAEKIIRRYAEDPDVDFHETVAAIVGLIRKLAKNVNFGKLYGMGRDKMAAMIDRPRRENLDFTCHGNCDRCADCAFERYDREFPEMRKLLDRAARTAERRGYVMTLLGRRARFPDGQRTYSALNRVIQGTAADVMKLKLLELYRERKFLGITMRFTVHDEVCGDLEDPARAIAMKELLNAPCLDLKVPIAWNVNVGKNWRLS